MGAWLLGCTGGLTLPWGLERTKRIGCCCIFCSQSGIQHNSWRWLLAALQPDSVSWLKATRWSGDRRSNTTGLGFPLVSYLHLWRPSPGKEWEKGENRGRLCLAGWRAEISGRKKSSSPAILRVQERSTATGKRGFPNTACRNRQVHNTDPEPVLQVKDRDPGWNQFLERTGTHLIINPG